MLTTDEIERITVEATLGIKSSFRSKEAKAFRKKIEADIKKIRNKGGQIDIESDNP